MSEGVEVDIILTDKVGSEIRLHSLTQFFFWRSDWKAGKSSEESAVQYSSITLSIDIIVSAIGTLSINLVLFILIVI